MGFLAGQLLAELLLIGFFFADLIDQCFNHLFFQINIKGQCTDKGKKLQVVPVFFGSLGKGGLGFLEFIGYIGF